MRAFLLLLSLMVNIGFSQATNTNSADIMEVPQPPKVIMPDTFENSLGVAFKKIPHTDILMSIWLVRVRDYASFAKELKFKTLSPKFHQTPDHPVVMVSWEDASAFCQWLTNKERSEGKIPADWRYRLPTDLEWSLAAGLPEALAAAEAQSDEVWYPWGKDWPPPKDAGNFSPQLGVDNFEYTSPVGTFAPNALGFYDMGGNVWQWCIDAYQRSEDFRVLRGGSWRMRNPSDILLTVRVGNKPGIRLDSYGFRPVLETKP